VSEANEISEADYRKFQEELAKERQERNYFQLERDKINNYWDITKNELNESKSQLLTRDRELEELKEK
jgi:hypothetical protein